ncbi:methyl-accepting chemotaxis protein [Crassaminicella profunda]|uniref:methyl-accepting chemotaxis protein n=1 Tax=Crassaminicella profunda TaxID=1286698 RepID=UPI001CA72512|nr:methyl-accepting chemotaxis protein [Crassaminicella profunda]QZY54826.1 methyl-accepting chemotaxis protein [Crassaminicella profunda]
MEKKSKKTGIRFKLITILVLLIALPLVSLGTNDYLKSVSVTEKELKDSSLQTIEQLNLSVDNYLGGIESFINFISNEEDIRQISSNPDALADVLKKFDNFKKSRKDIESIYIGTKDKKVFPQPSQSYDPTQRPWYIEAVKKQNLSWTQPYVDNTTKKWIVSAVKPIYDEKNQLAGVLAVDIGLDTLAEMLNNVKIGQKGYPFVVDGSGMVIFHKNEGVIGKTLPVKKILEVMGKDKNGIVDYDWDEEGITYKKFVVYSTLDKLNWKIAAGMYIDEIQEKTASILKNTLMVGGIALLIAIGIAYAFATSITNPIKTLVHDMKKVSEGDLSIRRKIKRKDEIGQLGIHFNTMVEDLAKLTNRIQEVSTNITSSSQNLAATSELTSSAAEEVAAAIDTIARGATDQATDAEKGANLTIKLADNFNELTTNFDHIKKSAEHVMHTSDTSMDMVNELKEKTELNNQGTQAIEGAIIDLDNRIKDIGNILETIDAIADQTNLLALNASIEAARAGEAGKGFTVVAEQIRKLAEESRVSSQEIKEIIVNVQDESNNTVGIMKEVKDRSKGQTESVVEVYGSFEKISNEVHGITEKIEQLSDFANHINEDKDIIVKAIENISAVSEETAASSEEVNASMQQQAMAVEQIAEAADKLDNLSMKLNEEMSRFKI